ncbi:MAG: sel1 repeat family protein [Clostridia bacterium]|nr:sel1 repeat family protein [Clostridia bacterium]
MNTSFDLLKELMKAEAGNRNAMRSVAYYLLYENDMDTITAEEAERCVRYLSAACEAGDPDAMLDMGGMYLSGNGIPADRERALFWYRKAAELDHPLAFNRLAQFYLYDEDEDGLGYLPATSDPERIRKAFEYFRKGAELGEVGCMVELGIMYMCGECCDADTEKGFRIFEKAYQADTVELESHAQAAFHLAVCYHYGDGVEKNLSEAKKYILESRQTEETEYIAGRTGSRYFLDQANEEMQKIIADMEDEQASAAE